MNVCMQCGAETKNPKFCGSSCSAKYNNVRKKQKRGKAICKNCGNFCSTWGRKFCSNKCGGEWKTAKVIADWMVDPSTANTASGLSPTIRRYLIQQVGYKCQDCGWDKINPATGKSPLDIEHVDGNHHNNSIENLKVLCPNCHSLTLTYKALNRGHGRAFRRSTPS